MLEIEEKNNKKLTVRRIADLLRFRTPLNEESIGLIEKIVEDDWELACSIEKMRTLAKKGV